MSLMYLLHIEIRNRMLLKRGMENGEWGMVNGEWGMGKGKLKNGKIKKQSKNWKKHEIVILYK